MSICISLVFLGVRHPNANPVLVHTGFKIDEVGLNASAIHDIPETLTLVFLVGAMVGNDHLVGVATFLLYLMEPAHAPNDDEPSQCSRDEANVKVVHVVCLLLVVVLVASWVGETPFHSPRGEFDFLVDEVRGNP